jgi:GNAT superfamily N-acetyltransferase
MEVTFRKARSEDAGAAFDLTRQSIAALATEHYTADQIAGWMGERTPSFYAAMIARGRMTVAERDGVVIGFVDAEPGEITRLFVAPEAAGGGLGSRLLALGVEAARIGHGGAITVEATLNAEGFYRRHGFHRLGLADFSHGLGGPPIRIVLMRLGRDDPERNQGGGASLPF